VKASTSLSEEKNMKIVKFAFCLLAFAALALPVLRPQDIVNPIPGKDIVNPIPGAMAHVAAR
jgi:hypothetical protein